VKGLCVDLSTALENGSLSVDAIEDMARVLSGRALDERASGMRRFHAEAAAVATEQALDAQLDALAPNDFEAFQARVEHPQSGIVFTAHPTFAMAKADRVRLASLVEAGLTDGGEVSAASDPVTPAPNVPITLHEEHEEAVAAIGHAQTALVTLNGAMLDAAQRAHPDRWRELTPAAFTLSTWVGYDLDGRTDIHWGQTLLFRLSEKAAQLERYADLAKAVPDASQVIADVADTLRKAAVSARRDAEGFAGDLDDPEVVVAAANRLTEPDADRIVSLADILTQVSAEAASAASDGTARALLLIKAEMVACGLGVARVHLRVNAAQVRSALRADLDVDPDAAGFGRLALSRAAERAASVQARAVNFASVFLERMTARRQFMLCSQLIKHIDADSPIRFLIAECEAPATVMGAIYLARLYGVADKVDISPLFETSDAMERGGRFMEQLLGEPEYRAYIRVRGRLAVQLGFSDSGRFMGQIAAALAIERFHILLARALAHNDIRDVPVILFNTHGESMGRGADPKSFAARMDHLFTPWARSRYAHEKLSWTHETSFQGGDGFLHFATPVLALSTARAVVHHHLEDAVVDMSDPFYVEIDFTWDVYRALKAWQESLFDNTDYHVTLFAFATNLLPVAGSRRARRPSSGAADPRSLRAIPHNAVLQQMAIPANVVCGIASSVGHESDRFVSLVERSTRARAVVALASRSRRHMSLPVFRAYAGLYDASFWVARAARADSDTARASCAELGRRLQDQSVFTAMTRLANHLAGDLIRFDGLLSDIDGAEAARERHSQRAESHVLHAVRQALVMHAFLLVAQLPDFSARHDVSREDVIDLVLSLRIPEAVAILDEIFPGARAEAQRLAAISEPADQDDEAGYGYPEIQATIVRPLARVHPLLLDISVGLSHHFGAIG